MSKKEDLSKLKEINDLAYNRHLETADEHYLIGTPQNAIDITITKFDNEFKVSQNDTSTDELSVDTYNYDNTDEFYHDLEEQYNLGELTDVTLNVVVISNGIHLKAPENDTEENRKKKIKNFLDAAFSKYVLMSYTSHGDKVEIVCMIGIVQCTIMFIFDK